MSLHRPISMVDLKSQYLRLRERIDHAVNSVLESGVFIGGPEVSAFEHELADYCGAGHVISCGNGTDALQIALMALELPRGSEVITPAFSYAAVAEVCHLLGLIPVYAEADPDTFLMDPASVETLITHATRVIIPVHLFGQCAPMDRLLELADRHGLFIIEDNAQAIGSEHISTDGTKRMAGTVGHISTTSFFPSKNLGCFGDGGAVMTGDEQLAARIRMIANHGQQKKYRHSIIGINSRLDALQAAVLRVKLSELPDFTRQRQQNAALYDSLLAGNEHIRTPSRATHSSHVFHQYTIKLKDEKTRDQMAETLKGKGIPTAIYYPQPLYRQEAYRQELNLPVSEDICRRVLSLPMGTDMETGQITYICDTILTQLNNS